MQTLTTQELKSKINNKESFVIDFFATWCGPCKVLMQNLQISEKTFDVPVFAFDIDADKEYVVEEMGIRSVPTLKIFKNGEVVDSKVGVQSPNQLTESVKKALSI